MNKMVCGDELHRQNPTADAGLKFSLACASFKGDAMVICTLVQNLELTGGLFDTDFAAFPLTQGFFEQITKVWRTGWIVFPEISAGITNAKGQKVSCDNTGCRVKGTDQLTVIRDQA
ncbi:hypothetical protein WH95_02290 [Kiloniella litopenaei]|uniref:Uncharacterized protein n=1 Tax=Kiloniella litopenaei TaxID=1549748 RepID=A0A0M2RDX3_9PROT|nr:hypothetical protein [Kiloniella litopenaei]KKJ78190.1 hypothetical protein WH95_02290 [Kiloniella litopenaei]